ncbi:hypothetical protein FRC11_012324 [Ceratobasidium sp. 423]|nr:hypothetical protein FRC11_012324 [Ceratobasidium sp. 423]
MTGYPPTEMHHHWGRTIAQYPQFYSSKVLSANLKVPLNESRRAVRRIIALDTIREICRLGEPTVEPYVYEEITARVTLPKLESVLELTRFPGELDNFALPNLVAGCITLMESIKPSPFHYEYGYLSFKLMIIALDTCLLKHGRNPNEALQFRHSFHLNDYLLALWTDTSVLITAELTNSSDILEVPSILRRLWTSSLLENSRLSMLLDILHDDQKNFTLALKEADSLGLCGLMYVLWKYVEHKNHPLLEQAWMKMNTKRLF